MQNSLLYCTNTYLKVQLSTSFEQKEKNSNLYLQAAARKDHNKFQEIHIVSDKIVHVTDDSFEQDVIKSDVPVLVDYWAEWCGPCKMIAPILEDVVDDYAGKLKIAKLNIDENPNTPPKFGIRGIPTLILFKDGDVEATKVGALSKSQLTAFIDSNL